VTKGRFKDSDSAILAWAKDVGKWWWAAVVGVGLGAVALFQALQHLRNHRAWVVAIALAVILIGSFRAYRSERARRLKAERKVAEADPRQALLREKLGEKS
jgi:type II secretory pathway component PulF